MAEPNLEDVSLQLQADVVSPRDLALVREACAFLAGADPQVATGLSVTIHLPADFALRIVEEYGLQASTHPIGHSVVLSISRNGEVLTRDLA